MKRIICLVFFVLAVFVGAVFAQSLNADKKPTQTSKTEKPSAEKTAGDSPAAKIEKEAKQLAPSVIMENTYLYVYINLKQIDADAIFDNAKKIALRFIGKAKKKSPKTFKSQTPEQELQMGLTVGKQQLVTWMETFEKEGISEIIILQSLEYQTHTPYLVLFPTTQEPGKKFNLKLTAGDTMFAPLKSIGKFKGCYCYVPAASQAATANMDAAAIFKLGKIRNSPVVINDALELQKRSPIRIIFAPSSGLRSLATLAIPAFIAQIPEETEAELEIDKKALTKDINYLITNTQSISIGITPQDPRITFAIQTPTEKAATTMYATLEKLVAMQAAFNEKMQADFSGMPHIAKLGGNDMMTQPMAAGGDAMSPTDGGMPQMMNGGMVPVVSVAGLVKDFLPVVKGKRLVQVFDNRTIEKYEDNYVDAFIEGYEFGKRAAGVEDEESTAETETLLCATNMQKIEAGLARYLLANGLILPPLYTVDKDGKPLHSWRVLILPFIGQQELYAKIRLDESWDSEYNKQFHNEVIPDFVCHSNPDIQPGLNCCYSAIAGEAFIPAKPNKPKLGGSIVSRLKDDPSITIIFVEVKKPFCWMDPTADVTLAELEKGTDAEDSRIGSYHEIGVVTSFFKGNVKFMKDINVKTWRALGTSNGGESVELDIISLPLKVPNTIVPESPEN
ncbi:MAG: DUF1559 domain-containing protein [Planctomycetaceae bacterium]|jgi:hypothetical protein|nr:DUF1559 domain-containing protein [Planctomycetaceae bacterium]